MVMYGTRLRELRRDNNLLQKELAKMLGTTQMNISKLENEERDLSTDMIIKICRLFDVSSDYLLGLTDF